VFFSVKLSVSSFKFITQGNTEEESQSFTEINLGRYNIINKKRQVSFLSLLKAIPIRLFSVM
jgi:hypothetical protein